MKLTRGMEEPRAEPETGRHARSISYEITNSLKVERVDRIHFNIRKDCEVVA